MVVVLVLALGAPASATTTSTPSPDALRAPASTTQRPPGHRLTAEHVLRIARGVPSIRAVLARHVTARAYLKGADRWQASFFSGSKEIGQVLISDPTGTVLEAWTGFQVAWSMARGYPGAFGHKVNALYIWLPLLVLFVAPFVDVRRPLRWRHLDLLALASLSVSLAFFNHANLGMSVPLTYPPLLYLLARLLYVALHRDDRPPEPLHLLVPPQWLAVGLLFGIGFRVGLNLTDGNVIDVGYAGVIGAGKLVHGAALYGHFPLDNQHGDTYGPVNYLLYVPFERIFGFSGRWDDLPAAHAAAVAFDLLCVGGMYLLGRRLRGPVMGLVLAYAWVMCPFTLFTLESSANDELVAALVIATLLVAQRPAARGALAAVAGLTKFAPLALAPLLATADGRDPRRIARFVGGFVVAAGLAMIPVLTQRGGLSLFVDRTLGYQADRGAPFSIYGIWALPHAVEVVVQVAGVLFALAAAVLPRRRDTVGLAAMAGAVIIAVELGLSYWFYLYVLWFLPLALVGLVAVDAEPVRVTAPARAPARSRPPAAVASTG